MTSTSSAEDRSVNKRSFSGRSRRSRATIFLPFVVVSMLSVAGVSAQGASTTPPSSQAKQPALPSRPAASPSIVDQVIQLIKSGISEKLVIDTLKVDNKPYKLSTADLVKLSQAGVSESVINAIANPGGIPAGGPAVPAVASTGADASRVATPFPRDLPGVPAPKRRLAVRPFDYATVTNWVNYWFNDTMNIGEGIRSMLTVRLNGSPHLTMLERSALEDVLKEQDLGASNRVRKGTNARVGQVSGADAMLYGDIVIFGRDDTTKGRGVAAVIGSFSPVGGAIATLNQSEKAVVAINLRLVDTETGEVIETAEARGESSRSSRNYAGLFGGKGAAAGASSSMTSANFAQTIIGEATANAVANIVKYLETRVPQLPAKPRQIEGRVAAVTAAAATLTVGSEHGVIRGDRFEILKINGEVRDPVTKDVIDLDAVKVGELVVDAVRERVATGAYGGQPLSSTYATADKGYAARLMSK
jgi:curli biogenesis system outer membrane secretion channel CsgG